MRDKLEATFLEIDLPPFFLFFGDIGMEKKGKGPPLFFPFRSAR